jgi:hypothetical protein
MHFILQITAKPSATGIEHNDFTATMTVNEITAPFAEGYALHGLAMQKSRQV